MQKYAVTGFDENHWNRWGTSWLISLKELARFDGEIIVVGFGLSASIREKIISTGAMYLPGDFTGNIREDTLRKITELSIGKPGVYAYWDADVYFQINVDEVFDLAKDKFVVSANRNPGFLAGPHWQWQYLKDIQNMMIFVEGRPDVYACLVKNFGEFVSTVDNTWNFTDIPSLKPEGNLLAHKGHIPHAIHPSGPMKIYLTGRDIFFWERHKDLFQKFTERRKSSSRKLVIAHHNK